LRLWMDTAAHRAEWTHRLISTLESGSFRMADD